MREGLDHRQSPPTAATDHDQHHEVCRYRQNHLHHWPSRRPRVLADSPPHHRYGEDFEAFKGEGNTLGRKAPKLSSIGGTAYVGWEWVYRVGGGGGSTTVNRGR